MYAETLDRTARSFFGAMAGLILLDIVLLFWLLHPFSGLAPAQHAYPLMNRQAARSVSFGADLAAAPKPSPLGARRNEAKLHHKVTSAELNRTSAFVEVKN